MSALRCNNEFNVRTLKFQRKDEEINANESFLSCRNIEIFYEALLDCGEGVGIEKRCFCTQSCASISFDWEKSLLFMFSSKIQLFALLFFLNRYECVLMPLHTSSYTCSWLALARNRFCKIE